MSTQFIALEEVRVATPCRADWDKMHGDDKTRFCQSCAKNVYNLSDMTHDEAEALVREKEGQLCVRFFQRADGTVLTNDCPVGTKSSRRAGRVSAAMLTILAAPFLMVSAALAGTHANKANLVESLRNTAVVGALMNKLSPQQMRGKMTMGAIAVAPPTATPTPAPAPNEPMMGDVAIMSMMGRIKVNPPKIDQPTFGEATIGKPIMGAPLPPKQCPPK
jgi:hypothetical protein